MSFYLTHAKVVLPDEVLMDAALLVEDGIIQAINPEIVSANTEINLAGQWLMPGMIDLHCDAIEKEVEPRKQVLFPLDFACQHIDRRNAVAGITTVYHAISFAAAEWGVRNNETAAELIRQISQLRSQSLVDNRAHVRYEITDEKALPIILKLLDDGVVDMLSIMDHTPGQGQFKHLDSYVNYMMGNHGISFEDAHKNAAEKIQARLDGDSRVLALLERAKAKRVPTASHDDDSTERVTTMKNLGAVMSEFPTNIETAQAAHHAGLATILGAPNVFRGGSQSGNMRALDAIHAGVADCLCADYAPTSMLAAIWRLINTENIPAHQAVKLVSQNPAQAVGLLDRGKIAVGLRADLISVTEIGTQAVVTNTWSAGKRCFATDY